MRVSINAKGNNMNKIRNTLFCFLASFALLLYGFDNAIQVTTDSPKNGDRFTAGEAVVFLGSGTDSTGAKIEGSFLVWTSSKDGRLGTGNTFIKNNLSKGNHTITLTAAGTNGRKGSASVRISIEKGTEPTSGLFPGTIILGRPTDRSITANILSPDQSGEACFAYGVASGNYTSQTTLYPMHAATPLELTVDSLSTNTQYYYQVRFRRGFWL